MNWCRWLLLLFWIAGGVAYSEPRVHRYLHTLAADYGLLDLVRSESFFTPLARALGATVEYVGNEQPEEVLQSLMSKPVYRAYASIYAIMETQLLYMQDLAAQQGNWQAYTELNAQYDHLDEVSLEQVPFLIALDRDIDFDTLREVFSRALFNSSIPIYLFSDIAGALYDIDDEEFIIVELADYLHHHGAYLLRSNRVVHPALSSQTLAELQQLGWDDKKIAAMPQSFADKIVRGELTPQVLDSAVNGLDLAIVIDLATEGGVFEDVVLSLIQIARLSRGVYTPLKTILARELLLNPEGDDFESQFAAAVAVLNDPERPATLAQLTQLTKLDYSLDDIRALTYSGREAIIVSNPIDKHDFEQQFGALTMEQINTTAAEIGPLFFYLRGLGSAAADINPHHPSLIPVYPY